MTTHRPDLQMTGLLADAPVLRAGGRTFQYTVFRSMKEAAPWWQQAEPADDHFLKTDYLSALAAAAPDNMEFRYVVVWQKGHPVGVIYTQLMHFRTDKSLNTAEPRPVCTIQALLKLFKSYMARKIAFDGIVCGNLLVTGEHAFHFTDAVLPARAVELVAACLDQLSESISREARKPAVVLAKDFPVQQRKIAASFVRRQYQKATFQPNMVLPIRPHWQTFDDYLADMTSKYRVRARRARKKAARLKVRELSLAELQTFSEEVYRLYKNIAEQADFNAFLLHPDYFVRVKEHLADHFVVTGWFDGEQLVGFNTAVRNGRELDAHFLGYDPAYNPGAQIYLNMLYHLIELAITLGSERLVLGRTALEIKSSVGAEPEEMNCFLRHRSTLPNALLPSLIDYLEPRVEWVQRRPFKDPSGQVERRNARV